ncbi:hypothetical protein AX15_001798 [Amanita polypyramis BW_CC]|nr:hypothetical protein AX15_001798 [Amanita polypyramis BW_CC]
MVRSTGGSPRNRPVTRSSLRQSLGKAFADVINKEGKDGDKATRKIKDTRRLSAINLNPVAPRNSMGDIRPPPQLAKRTGTPDSDILTRKRLSTTTQRNSVDDQSSKSSETIPQNGPVTRSATLRPSSRLNTISSLPKYRPRSAASEIIKQPPSPPRISTRRRLRTSEDEKEENKYPKESDLIQSSERPISPLPHRALFKSAGLASSTPPSTPSRHKPSSSSSAKSSPSLPSRPPKAVKIATSSVAPRADIAQGYSSSSSSVGTPRTPKTSTVKTSMRRIERDSNKFGSTSSSPRRSQSESPLPRHQPRRVVDLTHDSPIAGNMSHISEATSEEEDVALLLAPVADPTAPTPAMPRLGKMRNREKQLPVTPVRPNNALPSRAQMSYLSPLRPGESSSASHLRPPQNKVDDDKIFRGSILSWEQVANEASKSLGEEEVHSMLADVPAPFGSGPISPSISFSGMDIPDSPCLSALNSPSAFGTISQVLLPDVTPSPAVHNGTYKYDVNNDLGTADGALVTLLKLQLVALENTAKERLIRLQTMEEEMHNLKEEHKRETSELSMQLSQMQGWLYEKEDDEDQLAVERTAYTALLEEQLKEAHVSREKAIQDEIVRYKERERASRKDAHGLQRIVVEATCAATVAQAGWDSVHGLSEAELEMIRSDRQLLSVILAELDRMTLLVQ